MSEYWLTELKWDQDGLIPAIAQDSQSGQVMMFAWMNKESLALTMEKGFAIYWSRSRQKLWAKGEESGNTQKIISINTDCDKDVLLLEIEQVGGIACHTGRASCFYHQLNDGTDGNKKWEITSPVLKDPKEMYKKS